MAELTPAQHATLRTNPWFLSLEPAVRDTLVSEAGLLQLAPNEWLYHRGDQGVGFHCVLSGAMRVSGTSFNGKQAVLTFLHPGFWFGELSQIDGGTRTHDIAAHNDALLLRVRTDTFKRLLHEQPSFTLSLLLRRCNGTRTLMGALEDFNLLSAEQRLAQRLVDWSNHFGVDTTDGVLINLHLPQEILAQVVGASRPRVSQILSRWQQQGLLAMHYGQLKLLDRPALETLAQHTP